MSKIVVELPDFPVSGDLIFYFVASDPETCKVVSSADLRCRVICLPHNEVLFKPYFRCIDSD